MHFLDIQFMMNTLAIVSVFILYFKAFIFSIFFILIYLFGLWKLKNNYSTMCALRPLRLGKILLKYASYLEESKNNSALPPAMPVAICCISLGLRQKPRIVVGRNNLIASTIATSPCFSGFC